MFPRGVYPAAVTPFDAEGGIDQQSLARLLAWFEAGGCQGVVLAGTNGEGPSLSAVEKRDLVRAAMPLAGDLKVILGIATPSLNEAVWLTQQAGKAGAAGVLVMPPSYFRSASEEGLEAWFRSLADESPIPMLVYNFPKMTGLPISAELLGRLMSHTNIVGVKDSSGERENLDGYRDVVPADGVLFVGDETLLPAALEAGWSSTISGAANIICHYLSRIVAAKEGEIAATFELVLPVLQELRRSPQPATNKAVLAALGILARPDVRLPLLPVDGASSLQALEDRLGIRPGVPLV